MVLDRKIAFVDLQRRTTTIEPVPLALPRTFLGGRGINMQVLSRYDTAHLDPFSPENPLIFGAGLLTGTLGFRASLPRSAAYQLVHLGVINTEKSAIRVQKDDLNSSLQEPIVCRQCEKMICPTDENVEAACERKVYLSSISRAERCPLRAFNVFADIAYHCDLCGEKPQCVRVSTPKAIHI
jgi:hypothetical protein